MRVVFMGTPEFAVPSLEGLSDAGHEIAATFTRQDKPKGRGLEMTPPPVKLCAQKRGIRVFQPATLKTGAAEEIIKLAPDVIVVVAYGRILPEQILSAPKYGCINLHASLLPRWRGAAPIQRSVINGDKESGDTTMFMAKGIDTGDMILQRKTQIGENETFGELHDKLMTMGPELLNETLALLEQGKAPRIPQNGALATQAPMIDKSTAVINWTKPAEEIHNLVRGLSPFPKAQTKMRGKTLKILTTRVAGRALGLPGTLTAGPDGLFASCGAGTSLKILELQEEGRRAMIAEEYLRGHRDLDGVRLGETARD